MSMYRQLWLAIIASTLLALGGSLLVSLLSARSYLESQLSIKNTDNATALALSLSQSKPDAVMAELVVASLFDGGHYERIRITDPMGKLIAERVAAKGDWGAPAWFVRALPIHAHAGVAQITHGWSQFGAVTVESHSRFAYAALWKSAYEMVAALAVAGAVGGLLASLVLGRLRRPLDAVIEQARAITLRRFVTIEVPKVPELRQLALAMNATVARLKTMFEEEAARLEGVRRDANFDALTGLTNRTHFMARLRQELDADDASGGVLLLIRLADLSEVNRRQGRAATDAFLQRAGAAVQACGAVFSSSVAARLNGADFALLLPGADVGRGVAEGLLHDLVQLASPFVEDGAAAWIGVGAFDRGADAAELLAHIDAALASAQAAGGNGVVEAPRADGDDLPKTAEQWAAMIHRALENQWVRLISFPVADMAGTLSHRECPLRLMFDEHGEWLPAGKFFPFAERLKLTYALDLAAVKLGLEQLQEMPSLPGLAINLSASSLNHAGFARDLLRVIEAHREVAPRLWLEMTESGAHKYLTEFRALSLALNALGCRTGLEHFGHQFSQIGLLHDIGLDYLKVDASFVRGVDSNAGNAAFLKGLCSIAHNIGLQVFAEGVTTPAELASIEALGFDGATGPAIRDAVAI